VGLLINSSEESLYASNGTDFAEKQKQKRWKCNRKWKNS
jgi:hypothetical protein